MTEATTGWPLIDSPDQLTGMLADRHYLAGEGLAAAAFLALRMGRPLFLEGDPGVGKTDFARKIAEALDARCIRLQCHAGLDVSQALYDWNFPRQILALRVAGEAQPGTGDRAEQLRGLYTEEFLQRRPILQALEGGRTVLLIDEIDRADDEFEALLLQVLEDYTVGIPELDDVRAPFPPLVILTSNRTREVHDALKRRCLYHWIAHPEPELEERILRERVPKLEQVLARQIATGMQRVRSAKNVTKPPGVAESIDFAAALTTYGAAALTPATVDAAVSTVVKHHEDLEVVRQLLLVPHQREAA
ncbi:AAA family ATPase [Micromonospora sp. NBC_01796]|uniref:AAA family ATPase n=1 Tax=Micromonospora sp. NBC_01796 TaxID=2975987 RepID=UPI002DDB8C62|nr:MoxR family ATPase [Micromonospora sp. NBC_01796]WSA84150.1 MoxR family ATPase [Micromonospora sp. NBC_01796]